MNAPNTLQKCTEKEGRTVKLVAWKMNKAVTEMCHDNCENERNQRKTQTDPRVLMLGLLAQSEKVLIGPNDAAELHLWSCWRPACQRVVSS